MTYAPGSIRAVADYLTSIGFINLGIVGDADHVTGGTSYHLGKSQLAAGAYSAKTIRDRLGLTEAASALDIGHADKTALRALSGRLVARARVNAPGTIDWREIIYSPDGVTVLRWDRERGYDSAPREGEASMSHLTHTHISWYRDSELSEKVAAIKGDDVYHFKAERWKIDGGPALVTTVGEPLKPEGTVDFTSRLALVSETAGVNPRLVIVPRSRLTPVTAALDLAFFGALANYAIPAADLQVRLDGVKAKVAALAVDVAND